ncbi:MAG: hypothetical protein JWM25_1715 [Thermoleophilia bacterium]|nr:hypothetical protein [Thermoleophilia bacterium]MCZ4497130.1 hypothetical protein [Thermoleophilia bacterium]
MKKMRKIIAVGCCGLVLGGIASVFVASPATARIYARCDQQVDIMEADAAKQFKRGKLTQAQYDSVMASLAAHRVAWGC